MGNAVRATAVAEGARGTMAERARERRNHGRFWIDDRIIDAFAPVMRLVGVTVVVDGRQGRR
jgi:hypothetical protein